MGRPGHRVLVDPDRGGEVAGHEVVAAVAGRGRGHDHPAAAQPPQRPEGRGQVAHGRLVLQLDQVVEPSQAHPAGAAAGPQGLEHPRRRVDRRGRRGREVEPDPAVGAWPGGQRAAGGVEPDRGPGPDPALAPEHVGRGEGGVPAQLDLDGGGEPAQPVAAGLGPWQQEGRLRQVHLGRHPLHPGRLGVLVEQADRGRVAGERLGGEGVDLEQGPGHGRVRMARNMAVSSVSAGGSTRWNQ